jgi:hypothetical protein
MQKTAVKKFERAVAAVSESIANLKLFIETLNKFLQANGLGSASYSTEGYAEKNSHGYQVALFEVFGVDGDAIIYFFVYTDGTGWGENFTVDMHKSDINDGCTYVEAAEEVLRTIGVLNHTPLSREKIENAISALG